MSEEAPTCESCRWCLLEDNGYSNFTVEGTDFTCMKGAHPDGTFDRWYGDDKRLRFAATCPQFEAGKPVVVDVDHEEAPWNTGEPWWNFYTDDEGQREAIAALNGCGPVSPVRENEA